MFIAQRLLLNAQRSSLLAHTLATMAWQFPSQPMILLQNHLQ